MRAKSQFIDDCRYRFKIRSRIVHKGKVLVGKREEHMIGCESQEQRSVWIQNLLIIKKYGQKYDKVSDGSLSNSEKDDAKRSKSTDYS